jgi:hypothetical protein
MDPPRQTISDLTQSVWIATYALAAEDVMVYLAPSVPHSHQLGDVADWAFNRISVANEVYTDEYHQAVGRTGNRRCGWLWSG